MNRQDETIRRLASKEAQEQLAVLYGNAGDSVRAQTERYSALIRTHYTLFGDRGEIRLISAPGRTEIGGNHTDHNHGRVLAAAVNLDALCAVSPREDSRARYQNPGIWFEYLTQIGFGSVCVRH